MGGGGGVWEAGKVLLAAIDEWWSELGENRPAATAYACCVLPAKGERIERKEKRINDERG
jgi:hypothetical protein